MLVLLKNDGAAGLGTKPRRTFAISLECCSKWQLFDNQEVPLGTLPGQITYCTAVSREVNSLDLELGLYQPAWLVNLKVQRSK